MSQIMPSPGGLEFRCGVMTTRLTALRDDIVRVQISAPGVPEADGSWAVLPASRAAHIAVTAADDLAGAGFDTARVMVRMDRAGSALTIHDIDGVLILADAPSGGL